MKNKTIYVGIMVMIFCILAVGCDNNIKGGEADPALNGNWNLEDGLYIYHFDNGNFTNSIGTIQIIRGTYTTSGNKITMTTTHCRGVLYTAFGLDPDKWYTRTELLAIPEVVEGLGTALINAQFFPLPGTYSISGITLTLTTGGVTEIYTKI